MTQPSDGAIDCEVRIFALWPPRCFRSRIINTSQFDPQLTPTGGSCWFHKKICCCKIAPIVKNLSAKKNKHTYKTTPSPTLLVSCSGVIRSSFLVLWRCQNECMGRGSPAKAGVPSSLIGMMLWSKWYAIQPIHGAVVRLTWYAAVAYCHLSTTLVLLVQQ